jgi:transcriptional regulator with XRE-family HTH domain
MSLKLARKIAKLTQEELAKRAGIDNTSVSRLEKNSRSLHLAEYATVLGLARALNLEPEELFVIAELPDPPARRPTSIPDGRHANGRE